MCLGVPGKIIEFFDQPGLKMCKVDFGGITRIVCIEALPEAKVSDFVIVHAGFALNRLSEEEALQTLDVLRELELFNEELSNGTDVGEK